eukprot:TRINITY_DN291_c0_g1_i1.p1 TRINITY_DN291_c0_g1~~TRINITY_DN291_c0_g1_i1.p1  ORF type:complete len:130 (+),score=52.43 TRINITY_DN291_c0_g1_i1:185-574(+)
MTPTPEKVITLAEFNKHQTPTDLWICVRGKVLDVTKYQEDHPGSDTILQDMAGKDATTDFDDVGHTPEAKEVRDSLCIGHIEEEELKTLPGYTEHGEETDSDDSGSSSAMIVLALLVVAAAVAYTQLAM